MYHNRLESSVFTICCYSDLLYLTHFHLQHIQNQPLHTIMWGYSWKSHHFNRGLSPKTYSWVGRYSSTFQELWLQRIFQT